MPLAGPEILLIGLALVLLFGASAIPKLARSFGSAKREFAAGQRLPEEPATTSSKDEARLRAAARAVGIAEEGKSLVEVKAELARRIH